MQSVRQSMAGLKESHFLSQRKDTDYKKVLNLTFVYTNQYLVYSFPHIHFLPSRLYSSSLSLLSVMMEFQKTPYPRAGKTGYVDYLPVDKTFSRSGGLCKKHKKWREMKVVKFWHSSSGETCSNQSQEGLGLITEIIQIQYLHCQCNFLCLSLVCFATFL